MYNILAESYNSASPPFNTQAINILILWPIYALIIKLVKTVTLLSFSSDRENIKNSFITHRPVTTSDVSKINPSVISIFKLINKEKFHHKKAIRNIKGDANINYFVLAFNYFLILKNKDRPFKYFNPLFHNVEKWPNIF